MKRLVIIYNPRSSHFKHVQEEVLNKARKVRGIILAKYEILPTSVEDNVKKIAKIIEPGDFVIAAGGDGTANIALNGVMVADKEKVHFSVLGFGNFNDTARVFDFPKFEDIISGKVVKLYPIQCKINGKLWRYAMCYFTAGMFAESCAVFDEPKIREKLKKGNKGMFFSLKTLVFWWLKNHRRKFMPEFKLADSSMEFIHSNKDSDYMAINSQSVAKIMKGGKWAENETNFLSYHGVMTKFFKLVPMMLKSVFKQVPGMESDYDCLVFDEPGSIMMQAEGEYRLIENVKTLEVRKAAKPIYAVVKK